MIRRISKITRRKGSADIEPVSISSPLRKAAMATIRESESSNSMYDDDFERYAGEVDEDDEDNKELEYYKAVLNEDAEFVKDIISSVGGKIYVEQDFEEYERNLQSIKEGLQKSQLLTDHMVEILDSFDGRLSTLEETIYPIHRVMQSWKIAHENINKAMAEVSKVLETFDTPSKVAAKINDGARGEYDAYLACIDSLNGALVYLFNNKNFKSADKALSEVKALLKQGYSELETIFRSLVMKHSNPIDPLKLPEKPPERNRYLELVPVSAMEELKKIVKRFSDFGYTNHLKDYKDKRGKFLVNSLRKLNPEKFIKEAEGKGGYAKGSHKFIELLKFTLRLLQAERELCAELMDATNFDAVYADITEPTIDMLEEVTETLIKVKRNADSIFSVFVLFDIWENFNRMQPDLDKAVKSRTGKRNEPMGELVGKLRQVCQKSLNDFMDEVKSDSLKMLPVDGTVHELTSNTLNYLKRLFEYKDTVDALLPRPTSARQSSLGEFIIGVFKDLRENLEQKAKREKKATLANIFLLNNYHYMLKSIRQSDILTVLTNANSFLTEYEQYFDDQLAIYLSSWDKAADFITITVDDKRITGRLPSSKEKKFIKHKLENFNSEIEEQFHTQKAFSVPDTDLQAKLRQDAIDKIIPLYTKFLEWYGEVPFSKNKGKYLRYSADTLEQMLSKFFEGQAEGKKSTKFKF